MTSIDTTISDPTVSGPTPRGAMGRIVGTMRAFGSLPLVEQAALLTLPLLLLYVQEEWFVRVPVIMLSIVGLLFLNVRHSAYLWFALACFMAAGILFTWEVSDNHKYAICYWCLAIFFTLWYDAGSDRLMQSARLLLGLIFAFAFLWKLLTPDFLNGEFFQHAFLYDSRFSAKLELLGLLDPATSSFNDLAREALTNPEGTTSHVQIRVPSPIPGMATFLAWWTVVVEGLVALLFLVPAHLRITRAGDYVLMLFVASTYLVAPVIGFGWLLVIMGIIQCSPERQTTRLAYIGTLLLLQLFRLPWADIAESIR